MMLIDINIDIKEQFNPLVKFMRFKLFDYTFNNQHYKKFCCNRKVITSGELTITSERKPNDYVTIHRT